MDVNYKYSDITDLILKSYYNVFNKLGYGFLEKVYENGLLIELRSLNLNYSAQRPVEVYYNEFKVGQYFADIIVNDIIIIEIKAAESLCEEHEAQLTNYLKATDIEVGMLLNFGKNPEFKRKVFSNKYKIIRDHNDLRSITIS